MKNLRQPLPPYPEAQSRWLLGYPVREVHDRAQPSIRCLRHAWVDHPYARLFACEAPQACGMRLLPLRFSTPPGQTVLTDRPFPHIHSFEIPAVSAPNGYPVRPFSPSTGPVEKVSMESA